MALTDRPLQDDAPSLVNDQCQARLGALDAALRGQGFTVELFELHVLVSCGGPRVEIWCGPRSDDGGLLWFSEANGTPICEADDITSAVVATKGLLAARES